MNYKDVIRSTVFAVLTVGVMSCASPHRNVSHLDAGQAAHGSLEGEAEVIERAEQFHQKLIEQGVIIRADKKTKEYFDAILASLLTEEEKNSNVYKVYLTRSPDFNAFALGNGHIYFNLGLAAGLANAEQIAFVMAHEIEHINQRHSMVTYYRIKEQLTAASVIDIVLLGTKLSYLGAASNLSKHSQQHELDADRFAIERIERSGYDACVGYAALDRIEEIAPKSDPDAWFASHPSFIERTSQLASYQSDDCYAADNTPEYLEMRQSIFAKAVDSMLKGGYVLLAQKTLNAAPNLLPQWRFHQLNAQAYYQLSMRPEQAGKETALWQGEEYEAEYTEPFRLAQDDNALLAVEQATLAVELAPQEPQAYKTLGMSLQEQDPAKAVQAFETYIALKPNGRETRFIQHKINTLKRSKEMNL
ncbi:M48 family metallopeptidase [Echinimonas agarilytica]|uniref:M48 family metallopeptidase n=1 Tax=Echinimonas agarilytica TaxID=1215918 RepID=A0AA42B7B4_9GAMM|nr:M48 family metallopeptidase [Echinimonas agarilytica]MCM2679705.1 M48 family metallopeptidase [Echinimonas agarilytica]